MEFLKNLKKKLNINNLLLIIFIFIILVKYLNTNNFFKFSENIIFFSNKNVYGEQIDKKKYLDKINEKKYENKNVTNNLKNSKFIQKIVSVEKKQINYYFTRYLNTSKLNKDKVYIKYLYKNKFLATLSAYYFFEEIDYLIVELPKEIITESINFFQRSISKEYEELDFIGVSGEKKYFLFKKNANIKVANDSNINLTFYGNENDIKSLKIFYIKDKNELSSNILVNPNYDKILKKNKIKNLISEKIFNFKSRNIPNIISFYVTVLILIYFLLNTYKYQMNIIFNSLIIVICLENIFSIFFNNGFIDVSHLLLVFWILVRKFFLYHYIGLCNLIFSIILSIYFDNINLKILNFSLIFSFIYILDNILKMNINFKNKVTYEIEKRIL